MDPGLAGLRNATRDIHQRLHLHPAFAPLMGRPDAAGYARLLGQLSGFHVPAEARLFAAAGTVLPELADLPQRRKAYLLGEDIATLARFFPPAAAGMAAAIDGPHEVSRPAVLGGLYVIEGATLGGRDLARRVAPALEPLGLRGNQGRRFLLAYGSRQGEMWRHFCTVLGMVAGGFSAAEHDEMQEAAQDMFSAMAACLEKDSVLSVS